MSTETELKLRIAPENFAKLARHRLFSEHQLAAPTTRQLHNIYFDTPELDLNRNEMALRLRLAGGRWLQTLKGGGSIKGGLHQRNEWEMPVPTDRLDFTAFDAAVCDEYLPLPLRERLEPVFATDFQRSSRILAWQGAEIEVCMDHGEVRAGRLSAPICEVELELKSGAPQQLFELALAILEIVPFELESVSKAERGFRLMAGHVERPAKAKMPGYSKKASLTEVLQALAWACLSHLQNNIHGAMSGGEPEYLHQMRVALRRLRLVLRLAEKMRPDAKLTALREELTSLSAALGHARDWDVFIAALTQHPPHQAEHHNQALQALLEACENRRTGCYQQLRNMDQQCALQRLMLHFALWMNSAYWDEAESEAPETRDFASRQLRRLQKRYQQAEHHLDRLDAEGLHELRILARKLRYSAELFAPLHDDKGKKTFIGALGAVQEALGQIHDDAIAHHLLDELASAPELAAYPEIITLIREWIGQRHSTQLGKLDKAIRLLAKQQGFRGD